MLIAINDYTYVDTDAVDVVRIGRAYREKDDDSSTDMHEIQIWIRTNSVHTGVQYDFSDGKKRQEAKRDLDTLVERIREHRVVNNLAETLDRAQQIVNDLQHAMEIL